jgi:hypothetical protein
MGRAQRNPSQAPWHARVVFAIPRRDVPQGPQCTRQGGPGAQDGVSLRSAF